MDKERALWYGAAFGTSMQLAIEIKDAYAPYWGFSKHFCILDLERKRKRNKVNTLGKMITLIKLIG